MAVTNLHMLNAKAREHTEWAVAWLEANNIPATVDQRGKHPAFVLERHGNKRRVTFAGSPSSITPNAVFKDVRIAALELGYTEVVDREGRPVTAIAALLAPKPEKTDVRHLRGAVIPEFPEEFKGRDTRGLSQNEKYIAYKKARVAFCADAQSRGASTQEIYDALIATGHRLTKSVVLLDIQEHETGKTAVERAREREALGIAPRARKNGDIRIPAPVKKVPLVTLNAIGLLIEEAARNRLSDLFTIRDNLKRDADQFDEARAAMKKEGSQIEALLSALAE